jgi:endonuclease/exonuclease/phosphatase family metal-dependent hydrolase
MNRCVFLCLCLVMLSAPGRALPRGAASVERPLRVASWNLEWLVSPATTRDARAACLAGAHAALPCDVALDAARSSADFAMLARYADRLDADVVALQEVENQATVARVFRDYDICLTDRRATQNVGFAIRRGLPHRCGPDLLTLSEGDHARRGAVLVVDPGGPGELQLLAVHLKSGCAREPLDSPSAACRLLARQLLAVADWIRRQTAAGHRLAVLGDFNLSFARDARDPAWEALTAGTGAELQLTDAADGTRFLGCYPGQTHTRYIDHVLVGAGRGLRVEPGSFFRVPYAPADVRRYRLSDHCPVGILLQISTP